MVYRINDASHAKDGGKLGPKWEGPYEVTESLGKGAYKLKDRNRNELPRTWNIFQEAAASRVVVLAESPVSTSIDQDAPSTSNRSTQEQEHSPIISQGFEELPNTPILRDDPLHESLHEDSTSQES
ncbi:hypothetical protein Tco_0137915 [Tanacetum coccineum]